MKTNVNINVFLLQLFYVCINYECIIVYIYMYIYIYIHTCIHTHMLCVYMHV